VIDRDHREFTEEHLGFLSGIVKLYRGEALEGPDLELVRQLAGAGVRTVAEGRIRTPQEARAALEAGAYAVTVGSALTRLEVVTRSFVDALAVSHAR